MKKSLILLTGATIALTACGGGSGGGGNSGNPPCTGAACGGGFTDDQIRASVTSVKTSVDNKAAIIDYVAQKLGNDIYEVDESTRIPTNPLVRSAVALGNTASDVDKKFAIAQKALANLALLNMSEEDLEDLADTDANLLKSKIIMAAKLRGETNIAPLEAMTVSDLIDRIDSIPAQDKSDIAALADTYTYKTATLSSMKMHDAYEDQIMVIENGSFVMKSCSSGGGVDGCPAGNIFEEKIPLTKFANGVFNNHYLIFIRVVHFHT
ncbi:hypothetical protein AGMMS50222_11100 [Endomicrobiia bacterium]|nr:hypothetical protein AGMMS50222_11100 [Endomicrobiia bacterium]